MPEPAFPAKCLVGLHGAPFIKNQGLDAGTEKDGLVGTMPAIFAQGAMNVDDFLAVGAESRPENHVAQNGNVQGKLAGCRQSIRSQQGGAKRLVADFGLELEELIPAQQFDFPVRFSRPAQVFVVFINALVLAPGKSQPFAIR